MHLRCVFSDVRSLALFSISTRLFLRRSRESRQAWLFLSRLASILSISEVISSIARGTVAGFEEGRRESLYERSKLLEAMLEDDAVSDRGRRISGDWDARLLGQAHVVSLRKAGLSGGFM